MLRRLLPLVVAAAALGPLPQTQAQEACAYEVDLREIAVAASRPVPPAGYSYAEQPAAAASAPGTRRALRGRVTADGADCTAAGTAVALEARQAGQTEFTPVRTTQTDGRGEFSFDPAPTRTAAVRAAATTPGGGPVISQTLALPVRVRVSATYTRARGCVLYATGSTFPSKPGHLVFLQVADAIDPTGRTAEEVKADARTDERGRYRIRWSAPCGEHDLVVTVAQSASNTAGRTLYVREDVLATRAG